MDGLLDEVIAVIVIAAAMTIAIRLWGKQS